MQHFPLGMIRLDLENKDKCKLISQFKNQHNLKFNEFRKIKLSPVMNLIYKSNKQVFNFY